MHNDVSCAFLFVKIPKEPVKEWGQCKECRYYKIYDDQKDFCTRYNMFTDYDRTCKAYEPRKH